MADNSFYEDACDLYMALKHLNDQKVRSVVLGIEVKQDAKPQCINDIIYEFEAQKKGSENKDYVLKIDQAIALAERYRDGVEKGENRCISKIYLRGIESRHDPLEWDGDEATRVSLEIANNGLVVETYLQIDSKEGPDVKVFVRPKREPKPGEIGNIHHTDCGYIKLKPGKK